MFAVLERGCWQEVGTCTARLVARGGIESSAWLTKRNGNWQVSTLEGTVRIGPDSMPEWEAQDAAAIILTKFLGYTLR